MSECGGYVDRSVSEVVTGDTVAGCTLWLVTGRFCVMGRRFTMFLGVRYSIVESRLRFISSFIGTRMEGVGCIVSAVHKPLVRPVLIQIVNC